MARMCAHAFEVSVLEHFLGGIEKKKNPFELLVSAFGALKFGGFETRQWKIKDSQNLYADLTLW